MSLNEEELAYVKQLQQAVHEGRAREMSLAQAAQAGSLYNSSGYEQNLIEYQLDLTSDLERIEHILRGDELKINPQTRALEWKRQEDPDKIPFNEFGVQVLMKFMAFYVTKNTLLSNYKDTEINKETLDFGIMLSDYIHNNYENMGMDTKDKMKLYEPIVLSMVHTVRACLLRAMNGEERESLGKKTMVTQTEPLGGGMQNQMMQQRRFKLMRPSTWF